MLAVIIHVCAFCAHLAATAAPLHFAANYYAAARTRALLARAQPTPRPSPHLALPFTTAHWLESQQLREAVDRLAYGMRWAVTVIASDGAPRSFFLKGPHASVVHRAHQIFGHDTRVVSIEPAAPSGAEMFDRRLNVSSPRK